MATERQVLQAVHSQMEANKNKTQAETQGQVIENARDALLLQAQEQIRNKNAQDAYNNQFRRAVVQRMKYGGSAFNLQEVVNNSPYLTDLFERMGVTNIQDTISDEAYAASGAYGPTPTGQDMREKIMADAGITPDMYNDKWKRDIINRATFIAFDKQENKWKLRYMPMMWAEADWKSQSDEEQINYAEFIKDMSEALLMPEQTDAGGEKTAQSMSSAKGKASAPGKPQEIIDAEVQKLISENKWIEAKELHERNKARKVEEETKQVGPDAEKDREVKDSEIKQNEMQTGLFEEMMNKTVEEINQMELSGPLKRALLDAKAENELSQAGKFDEEAYAKEQETKFKEEDRAHVKRVQELEEKQKAATIELTKADTRLKDRLPAKPTESTNPEVRKREAQEKDFLSAYPGIMDVHKAVESNDIETLERLASPEGTTPELAATYARITKGRDELYTDTQTGRMLQGIASVGAISKEKLDTLGQAVGPVDDLTKGFLKTFVEDKYVEIDSAEMDALIENIESFTRNALYGATLTDNELKFWKRQAFNHGKANLKSSLIAFRNIIRNRLSDLRNGYTDSVSGYDRNRQILFGRGIITYNKALAELDTKIASIGPDGNTIRSEERSADDLL